MATHRVRTVLVALLVAMSLRTAIAQTGAVIGRVTEKSSGAPVAGARVDASSVTGRVTRTV